MPRRLRIGFPKDYRLSADVGTCAFTGVAANLVKAAPPGGGDATITPSLVASHTTGPAPLGVRFDAVGSSSGRVADGFRQLVYSFDYGDPGAGTWSTGNPTNNSKNSDVGGPLRYHTFETPGTYTVTLTVADGTGTNTATATITVTDPDAVYAGANTICVNDSGVSDGLGPAGATYQSTMPSAATANGKRVLMRRGQSTVRSIPNFTGTQGAYFGAYGAGAKPVVASTLLQHNGTNRVVLRDLQGSASANFNFNCTNLLMFRCDVTQNGTNVSVTTGTTGSTGGFGFRNIFIAECSITGPNQAVSMPDYATLGFARDLVVVGCTTDRMFYHDLRHSSLWKGYFGHNNIVGRLSSSFFDTVKIHAQNTTQYVEGVSSDAGTYASRYIVFADNHVGNATFAANYHVSFAPQNTAVNEQVDDVIVENNGFYAAGVFDIAIYARRVTTLGNYRLNGGSVSIGASANSGAGGVVNGPNYTTRS